VVVVEDIAPLALYSAQKEMNFPTWLDVAPGYIYVSFSGTETPWPCVAWLATTFGPFHSPDEPSTIRR
jgi:hypothetical protein